MATQRVFCPFEGPWQQQCRSLLEVEFEPEDRSVGIMGPTITDVRVIAGASFCVHAIQAAKEVAEREWDDTAGPMEEKLHEALSRAWAEAEERYFDPNREDA